MKVFQNLKISMENGTEEAIIQKIDRIISSGNWRREHELEEDLLKGFSSADRQYAYTPQIEGLESATLWITSNDRKTELYVSNIVPIEKMQLSYEEYNAILRSFAALLDNDIEIKYSITKPEIVAVDFLPSVVYDKLKCFSDCANKSTGYSHPYDYQRWLDFAILYYKETNNKDYNKIERVLHEEMGWSDEYASKLSSGLSYAVDVLKHYEEMGN